MKPLLTSAVFAASLLALSSYGHAAGMLTDAKGMTLYTFDNDTKGTSSCYDACAKNWPPYLVKEGKETGSEWTQAKRKDGSEQWVYDGKPLYYFIQDKKKGDAKGEGLKGVWHTVME
jgi:predicted lipoprotein with Yx(FWY)xxD motif